MEGGKPYVYLLKNSYPARHVSVARFSHDRRVHCGLHETAELALAAANEYISSGLKPKKRKTGAPAGFTRVNGTISYDPKDLAARDAKVKDRARTGMQKARNRSGYVRPKAVIVRRETPSTPATPKTPAAVKVPSTPDRVALMKAIWKRIS